MLVAQIIASIVKDRLSATQDIDQALPLNYTFLATQTEGYSPTDLQDLVSRALHQLTMRASNDMDQVRDIPLRQTLFMTPIFLFLGRAYFSRLRSRSGWFHTLVFKRREPAEVRCGLVRYWGYEILMVPIRTWMIYFICPKVCMKHVKSFEKHWNGPRSMGQSLRNHHWGWDQGMFRL